MREFPRFGDFLVEIWAFIGLPTPTPIQLDIADYLQDSPDRTVLMGFRGVAKSFITGAYCLWLLYNDPQKRVMVVSASLRKAVNFVTFCLELVRQCPLLQHMEPSVKQRQSAQGFDVRDARPDQNPSLFALGITGQLNGPRADEIVPDDVETSSNSITVTMREKIGEAVKEFDSIIKPGGKIKYLGTPQTEGSIYLALVKRGYTVRIYPSEYPTKELLKRYGARLAPMIREAVEKDPRLAGHSTEPTRFPDEDLAKRRLSIGSSTYALQFLLDTSLSDADRYPLKFRNLIVMALDRRTAPDLITWGNGEALRHSALPNMGFEGDGFYEPANVSPQSSAYQEIIGALDTSGRGNDETSLTVLAYLHGMLFKLHNAGWKDGYGVETLRAIARDCVGYNLSQLIIETNFGDGMFLQLLQPYVLEAWEENNKGKPTAEHGSTRLIEEKASNQVAKERRIISVLEPITQQHRLVVNSEAIEGDARSIERIEGEETRHRYSLFYQYSHLTHEKDCLTHDDRLESLAIACAHFAPRLGVNPLGMAEKAQEAREDDELERFLRDAYEVGGAVYKRESDRMKAAKRTVR